MLFPVVLLVHGGKLSVKRLGELFGKFAAIHSGNLLKERLQFFVFASAKQPAKKTK